MPPLPNGGGGGVWPIVEPMDCPSVAESGGVPPGDLVPMPGNKDAPPAWPMGVPPRGGVFVPCIGGPPKPWIGGTPCGAFPESPNAAGPIPGPLPGGGGGAPTGKPEPPGVRMNGNLPVMSAYGALLLAVPSGGKKPGRGGGGGMPSFPGSGGGPRAVPGGGGGGFAILGFLGGTVGTAGFLVPLFGLSGSTLLAL